MTQRRLTIGVSLKMYFDRHQTVDWCAAVARIARANPALRDGDVELFVLPSSPMLGEVTDLLAATPVRVGAQNLWTEDRGAFTGEVSGLMLKEMGCEYAEIGHAERRAIFGESDELVGAKTAAALRNGLTPVLCVGEPTEGPPEQAAAACIDELGTVLDIAGHEDGQDVVVAYEPVWAIGQPEPASPDHIRVVTRELRAWLARRGPTGNNRVIYGGSAKLGLLGRLAGAVDGLFLGRFAHDPQVLGAIVDEAAEVQTQTGSMAWQSD